MLLEMAGFSQISSLLWGFYVLVLFSVLYEPVRDSLYHLGESVGGVGGVGGLTNQWNPGPHCNTTSGGIKAPWCFEPGWLGYTSFAGVILSLWTLPFIVTGFVGGFRALSRNQRVFESPREDMTIQMGGEKEDGGNDHSEPENLLFILTLLWGTLSCIWFVIPLAAFLNSSFYRQDVVHVVLGFALSSAFPLSWHMSYICIPASMSSLLVPLFGIQKSTLIAFHKRIAYSSILWVVIHAGGEIIYLISQNQFVPNITLSLPAWEDSLIFVFGLSTVSLFTIHTIIALFRQKILRKYFLLTHRALAALLLLSAVAHWWPFVFFLLPAIGGSATGIAIRFFHFSENEEVAKVGPMVLCVAMISAVLGNTIIWQLRQDFMVYWAPGEYKLAFIFPPLAIFFSFVFAIVGSMGVLRVLLSRRSNEESSPLLLE